MQHERGSSIWFWDIALLCSAFVRRGTRARRAVLRMSRALPVHEAGARGFSKEHQQQHLEQREREGGRVREGARDIFYYGLPS